MRLLFQLKRSQLALALSVGRAPSNGFLFGPSRSEPKYRIPFERANQDNYYNSIAHKHRSRIGVNISNAECVLLRPGISLKPSVLTAQMSAMKNYSSFHCSSFVWLAGSRNFSPSREELSGPRYFGRFLMCIKSYYSSNYVVGDRCFAIYCNLFSFSFELFERQNRKCPKT